MAARALADVDEPRCGRGQLEYPRIDQRIVQNGIGGADEAFRLAGQQLGIAGPGADQPHRSRRKVVVFNHVLFPCVRR